MLTKPIYYAGQPGNNTSGWGVCNQYLLSELSQMEQVIPMRTYGAEWNDPALDGFLFTPLADNHLEPILPARGVRNYGYVFFDLELSDRAQANAARLTTVFAGSTWCLERLREKGIDNTALLIQGVDSNCFHVREDDLTQEAFVIFSGGKFEMRKGQDLVLRAVQVMQQRYKDVLLVNSWVNQWPESMATLAASRHARIEWRGGSWEDRMRHIYIINGLDPARVVTLPLLAQEDMAGLYRQTHVGLFPNRCEGGTNLVLMEYMACGKPVIASHTSGHRDVITSENALLLKDLKPFIVSDQSGRAIARWEEPSFDEIIAQLEYAYRNRAEIRRMGTKGADDMKQFTWRRAAQTVVSAMAR